MVENQHHDCSIERALAEGKAIKLRLDELDVLMVGKSCSGRFQHRGLTVDREHAGDDGRETLGGITATASQIRHHPVGWQQSEQSFLGESKSEEFTTNRLPFGADSTKEGSTVRSALEKDLPESDEVVTNILRAGDT